LKDIFDHMTYTAFERIRVPTYRPFLSALIMQCQKSVLGAVGKQIIFIIFRWEALWGYLVTWKTWIIINGTRKTKVT
jgi:hypothetical protein